jgi:hypothetical protein
MFRMTGLQPCPFGTTSIRTVPLTKKDESQMPGPAHYQDAKHRSDDRLSHAFASTTSRLYSPPAVCCKVDGLHTASYHDYHVHRITPLLTHMRCQKHMSALKASYLAATLCVYNSVATVCQIWKPAILV